MTHRAWLTEGEGRLTLSAGLTEGVGRLTLSAGLTEGLGRLTLSARLTEALGRLTLSAGLTEGEGRLTLSAGLTEALGRLTLSARLTEALCWLTWDPYNLNNTLIRRLTLLRAVQRRSPLTAALVCQHLQPKSRFRKNVTPAGGGAGEWDVMLAGAGGGRLGAPVDRGRGSVNQPPLVDQAPPSVNRAQPVN